MSSFEKCGAEGAARSTATHVANESSTTSSATECTTHETHSTTADDNEVARLIQEYDKADGACDISSYELETDDDYLINLPLIHHDDEESGSFQRSFNPQDPTNTVASLDQYRRHLRRQELYAGGGCLPTIVEEEKDESEVEGLSGCRKC